MAVDLESQRRSAADALRDGRLEQARELFIAIVNAEPVNARSWSDLADCLLRLHDPDEALYCCTVAIQMDPTLGYAWYVLGDTFAARGKPGQAWSAYETALVEKNGLTADQEKRAQDAIARIEKDVDSALSGL